MAMPSSSDWTLACSNKTNPYLPFNSSTKTLPFLSLLTSSPPLITLLSHPSASSSSSSCHSPLLEDNDLLKFQELKPSQSRKPEDLNAVICSLLKDPKTQQLGFEYYEKAKESPDFKPHKHTLKHLVRYLMFLKSWDSIWLLSEDFEKFNVFPTTSTCCRLISMCIKARKLKLVNRLLDILKNDEDIVVLAFETAMRGYNKLHMYSTTIVMYENMKSCSIVLNPGCYCHVMEAYLRSGQNERVASLFKEFEMRIDWSPFLPQIYRILCESLGKSGRAFEALEFFRDMTKKGFTEDSSFYSILICSFANIRQVDMAEELMREAESKQMLKDPAAYLRLVLMYVEQGMMEKTLDVVAVMKRMNVRVTDCVFCAIVNGYAKKRGLSYAVKVYEDLILEKCEPGQVTYASIINVYCRLGLYSKAEEVFVEMEAKGMDKCVVAYSSLIATYGKIGRIRDAMRLVAKMKERGCEPNVWIYNSLLDMHGKVLNLRQVEKIWKEMKRRKVVADKVSYTSIINAYNKAKELEMCVKYYEEYRFNGGGIDRAMAGIMVGVFSKTSRVDELVKLLQDLSAEGIELDGRLYRSALNAMRDAGLELQAKWLQQSFESRIR